MAGEPVMLRDGLTLSGLTVSELWIRYFGLGGTGTPADLRRYVRGQAGLPVGQHDVVVQAINERLDEMDLKHPVPYATP